ncbi:MAG: hypothetical protein PHG63_03665 [Candidatus Dojkabacteria bacterium]|nr:hypothetical protein [Candidatus Dojkabacteria bacterium]
MSKDEGRTKGKGKGERLEGHRILLSLVLLAEVHDDLLSLSDARRLFTQPQIDEFCARYPDIPFRDGFWGKGSRERAMKRRAIARVKLERAQRYIRMLSRIPWITCAGVTGSVACGNAGERDDLDVLLFVEKNRLWLTRFLEHGVLWLYGIRRFYGGTYVRDRICVNYYRSDDNVDFRGEGNDLLTAFELVMIKPVINPGFLSILLGSNRWISDFFPNLKIPSCSGPDHPSRGMMHYVLDALDRLCMMAQIFYMRLTGHPYRDAVLERNRIRFVDPRRWDVRQTKLKRKLDLYNV